MPECPQMQMENELRYVIIFLNSTCDKRYRALHIMSPTGPDESDI